MNAFSAGDHFAQSGPLAEWPSKVSGHPSARRRISASRGEVAKEAGISIQ
jgi:hypothetical protein